MKFAVVCFIALAVFGSAFGMEAEEDEVAPKLECMCARIYLPVCSTENKTYPNKCEFDCYKAHTRNAGLRIARQGPCEDVVYE